jgi:hypothetical protein
MKKLLIGLLTLSLTGCSSVMKLMPKQYDPMMGSMFVGLKIEINDLSCKDNSVDKWAIAQFDAKKLAEYSKFRKDPQADNAASVEKNLGSAYGSSPAVCDNLLKITKLRLEVLNTAWSGR